MQTHNANCSTYGVNKIGPLVSFLIALMSLLLVIQTAFAATPWRAEIDATRSDLLQELGEMQIGFTYVVPPEMTRQSYGAKQTTSGYEWTLSGVELSAWQTLATPPEARYLLNWHFEYEGEIAEGRGRTGFIFGNPDNANLLSVEMTRNGSLRLLIWGDAQRGREGRIAWSRQVRKGKNSAEPVRIEADYDIRLDTLTCRVDGGEPIRVVLGNYMPSGPITIKGVGFFAAVPEAQVITRAATNPLPPEYEIDLSSKYTRVVHRRFTISAQ